MPKSDITVSLRMPSDLRKKIQRIADKERRSLSKQILIMLERQMEHNVG